MPAGSLGWPLVGASLFATNIGAEHLVGLSGDSYRYGLSAGAVELTTCICLGIACAVLFPYYIRTRVYTIPEYLELRYNRTARIFFSGLMLVICIMTKLAFHLYAGALVLHSLLGWNVMPMVMLMGACVAAITIIGGFTAVAYTDSVQTAIMIAGCSLMLLIGLAKVGGWHCPGRENAAGHARRQALRRSQLSLHRNHSQRAVRRALLLGHGPGQRAARARSPQP